MTTPTMSIGAIHDVVRTAAERGETVRLTTANGKVHEGPAKWDKADTDWMPIGLGGDAWFRTDGESVDALRVVHAEVIAPADFDGWIDSAVMTVEQARTLDGKLVEVDASLVRVTGLAIMDVHGKSIRVRVDGNALYADVTSRRNPGSTYNACVWSPCSRYGTRFRVIDEVPRSDGWIEVTALEQARALDGKMVEVDASAVRPEYLIAAEHGRTLPAKVDGGDRLLLGGVAGWAVYTSSIGLRLRVVEAKPATGPEHFDCRSMPDAQALLDVASLWEYPAYPGMRPELAAALARQDAPSQPTSSVCSACKGAGTQLLTSACPECKGTGSVTVAAAERYTYALHETFRDGDQVWAIGRGVTFAGYLLTTLDVGRHGERDGVLMTIAQHCKPDGKVYALGNEPQPGSFMGEHHGERAVAGYVGHLNSQLPTRR